MTASYFGNFPQTTFNGIKIPNILTRVKFIESLKLNSTIFYPYVIEEGETADSIATWYYGSPVYDWIIYLTNNIIDPYSQWPKSYIQFNDFIIKKYGSIDAAKSEILFYRKNPDIGYISSDGTDFSTTSKPGYDIILNNIDIRITPESYLDISDQIDYFPVYAYDYETELNENKRNISLIDKTIRDQIVSELGSTLNG